jgi:translation initiation factor 4G
MVKLSFTPKFIEILVVNNILLTTYKNPSNDDYFYSYLPFNEIDISSISDKTFRTLEEAQVDATKKNSFKRRLLSASQQEYDNSMNNEGKYGEFEKYKKEEIEKISKLSGEEKFDQQKLLDEQIMFLKKRKLGNIQFIGVLCKKSMLKVSIMFDCIEKLVEGDEDYLESLCHLLRTVGSTLESNISGKNASRLEISFEKLSKLAKNKNINSRIRFGIDEILELRKNQWITRRVQEGPAKISDFHNMIAQEEEKERLEKERKDNLNNNYKINSNLQQGHPISRQSSLGGHQTLTGKLYFKFNILFIFFI